MTNGKIFLMIIVAAICTFLMRVLPFVLLGGKKEIPQAVRYLGNILPAAIMAVLIVYCLKDVPGDFMGIGIKKIVAVISCVGLHLWKKNTFVSIVGSTAMYMILCAI